MSGPTVILLFISSSNSSPPTPPPVTNQPLRRMCGEFLWTNNRMPLTVNYVTLQREIGRRMGWGKYPAGNATNSAWTADQLVDFQDIIDNGMRRFYWPLPGAGGEGQTVQRYVWSFLAPQKTFDTSAGQAIYPLPGEFTDMATPGFTFATASGQLNVTRMSDTRLEALQSSNPRSGPPQYYAIQSAKSQEVGTTAYRVIFYPTPDATYSLQYRYGIVPQSLSATNTNPIGGAVHAETILEACLAEADKMFQVENGPHEQRFRDLLAASMLYDKSLTMPDEGDPWPYDHVAQDLRVDLPYLQRVIGEMIGIGAAKGTWTRTQFNRVKLAIERGLRRFYWPVSGAQAGPDGKPMPTAIGHTWSFLMFNAQMNVTAVTATYELPNDFMQIMSAGFIYSGANNPRLSEVSWEAMASLQASAARTGPPEYYCIRPRNAPAGQVGRYEAIYYPSPDANYTLLYQYGGMPTPLTDQDPYPLGGAQHAETIIEACLAEADSGDGKVGGPHEAKFQALLAASIAQDASLAQPQNTPVWPFENPAKGLLVNKAYLERLIGELMGYGPSRAIWDQTQSQKVKMALETGLRKFYLPPVLPGEKYAWEWSFLAPTAQMTLNPGQYQYDLPEDFSNLEQPFVYEPATTVMYPPIKIVSERQVMIFLQRTVAASMSTICCVRPKKLDESTGTRYEVLFWPVPDQAYGLTYTYSVAPHMLGSEVALPFGGQNNMQTIIEACLAAAEEVQGKAGLHSERFMEHMKASVSHDRKINSPQTLGRNHDRSDRGYGRYWGFTGSYHDMQDQLVDYEGYNTN